MARKPRVEFAGGLYHAFSRGNRKESVFEDDADRGRFIRKLVEYQEKYRFILYSYVLLKNHFHLLIETGEHPLSQVMQGILQSHSQYYNRRYSKVGHVFQGRFKAILCEKESYLLQLVRYIHLNPVRAGLVAYPEEYEWSSHRAYLQGDGGGFVDVDTVLGQFSQRRDVALKAYRDFVNEDLTAAAREDLYRVIDQRFLGSQEFVEELERDRYAREVEDRLPKRTLSEVAEDVTRVTGIDVGSLRGRGRGPEVKRARAMFVEQSIRQTNARRKEIAAFLGREASWVTVVTRRT